MPFLLVSLSAHSVAAALLLASARLTDSCHVTHSSVTHASTEASEDFAVSGHPRSCIQDSRAPRGRATAVISGAVRSPRWRWPGRSMSRLAARRELAVRASRVRFAPAQHPLPPVRRVLSADFCPPSSVRRVLSSDSCAATPVRRLQSSVAGPYRSQLRPTAGQRAAPDERRNGTCSAWHRTASDCDSASVDSNGGRGRLARPRAAGCANRHLCPRHASDQSRLHQAEPAPWRAAGCAAPRQHGGGNASEARFARARRSSLRQHQRRRKIAVFMR